MVDLITLVITLLEVSVNTTLQKYFLQNEPKKTVKTYLG